jgi:branched-chain amino acid transport system substrate-binding protein
MKQYEPKTPLNSSGTAGWYAGQVFDKAATAGIKAGATPTSAQVYAGLYSLGAKFDLGGILPAITYAKGKPAVQQECGWYMEVKAGKETAPEGTSKVCTN